eukprot:gene16457-biopygen25403
MPGRRNTPYDGKGGYSVFAQWYAELVAPLLKEDSVFSVLDGDIENAPIDEPSNGYHYPRSSRITPLSNYMAMDHILRNCTLPFADSLDAYTNNAAKALRYLRRNYGHGFRLMPSFVRGSNPFFDSHTTLTFPYESSNHSPASTQDAILPPPTPSHQPPYSPSTDGESSSPPTPPSDEGPSTTQAFEDAAAAADLLRGAIHESMSRSNTEVDSQLQTPQDSDDDSGQPGDDSNAADNKTQIKIKNGAGTPLEE